jgi:hypothetical protein
MFVFFAVTERKKDEPLYQKYHPAAGRSRVQIE